MSETLILYFDGGSRGNPGPAGYGAIVCAADGTVLREHGGFIGVATNNVAEYRGLIRALELAKEINATAIEVRGDSQLVVKQMLGEYRVRHPNMKPLYEKAIELYRAFPKRKITHNFREDNTRADKLANLAMTRKGDVTDSEG